jgi:hypothetical protein
MNVNTDAGNCTALVNYTAPVGTDNCMPTTTQTAGTASGSTYGIGTMTNTFEVTDGNLTANCSFNITVTDNEAPQITCPADINVNTDAGNCAALVNYTAPVGTDNCTPTTTQTAGFASGATYGIGTTTNIFEVTDGTTTASCSFNVVVTDSESPMAICQNISIDLDATGLASLTATQIDNGSSDNCGTANLSIPPTTFSCSNQGANNVTLTVDDGNGNSNICVAVVTVADPLGACCTAPQLSTTWTGALSNDWDDNANWTDCVPGAISAAIIPPAATSPTIFSGTNALAERVNIQTGGQLDIEDGADLTIANSTIAGLVVRGTLNNAGIISISDVGGHGIFSNTLNFNNAVTGQIIINGVGAHGLRNDRRITNFGTISIDGVTASARDGLNNEGGNTEFINHGNLFIGANGFIKTSAIGNRFSGTFVNEVGGLVTIDDNNQFAAIDNVAGGNFTNRGTINMGLNGNLVLGIRNDVGSGAVFLNDTDAVLTIDNVGLDGISINSGTTFTNRGTISIGENIPLGRHGIHLLNSSTFNNEACAKVYVYDNFRNPSGTFNNDGFLFLETSQSHQTGTFNNNGTVNTVDSPLNNIVNNQIKVSQSNVNSCVTEVSSAFDLGAAPTFTVLGVYTDDAATSSAGTYDAATNTFTPTPATTLVSGTDYTYFVEIDEGACTSISEWLISVNDTTNPTAICQDVSIQLDANGDAITIANTIDNGSNDACGIASLSLSQVSFDCSEEGTNTVTLTVTDNNGNSSTCNATVTVEDNLAPTVVVNDLTVYLDENGATNITTADLNGGSFDNCGIATMLLSPASTNGATASFDCASVGTNTVTLTVIDVNGNVASESATITVVDALPAEIECRQPISTTVTPGMCERMDLTVLEPFVLYDNCGIDAGISISRTPAINDFPVGTTVLTWTVTDSNGNDATCESLVIIEDNEAPVFNSYNTIIDFLEPNECSAQVTVEIDATDNCGITSIDGGGSFSLPFGIHEEMITITDMNGNVTTQYITIYVHDDQAPELVSCPDNIGIVANQGENSVELPEPIFTDNCGFDALSNDAPAMFTVGTTTVTWTAEDTYGNTTDCSYDVTVTPSIFFTGTASPIEASTEGEGESSMVTWNRPEAITHCEACLVTDMPDFIFLGEFEGHQYFLYPNATNWMDATVLSEEINAQLVTINDVRENDFIQNQLPATLEGEEEVQYWTGLSYQNYDFSWLTDAEFDYVNFGFDPVLNFDVINAGAINVDGAWVMQTADVENGFIAERPCLDVTQVAPIIETEGEDGEIIETLLTPDADWATGEYTVIYEATDMCDSTAVFSFGVTVQEPTAIYCQTSGLDQEVWLDRVVFNDYLNESENNAGYADYTEEAVELLGENPLSVQLIPGGIDLEENETPLYWRIFADWNNDGDFFDADEILHEQTSMNIVNVEFPAILNEEDLSVRLRIAVAKGEYPEACADYTTGEAEDYALFFPAIDIEEEEGTNENNFTIYPNPADNQVTIDLADFTQPVASISISDNIGTVRHRQTLDMTKQRNLSISLQDFNSGIYFVNITTAKGEVITKRLVVTRIRTWSAKK